MDHSTGHKGRKDRKEDMVHRERDSKRADHRDRMHQAHNRRNLDRQVGKELDSKEADMGLDTACNKRAHSSDNLVDSKTFLPEITRHFRALHENPSKFHCYLQFSSKI
jgi:hypothetical protein